MWFDDDIFEEFRLMQREMARMLTHMGGSGYLPGPEGAGDASLPAKRGQAPASYRMPVTDLMETESAFIASIELPGVDKKDIELNVTERAIEVRVDRTEERKVEDQKRGVFNHASVSRQFYRSFPLPKPVVADKTKAELTSGVLRVEVPKADKGGSRRVSIQ